MLQVGAVRTGPAAPLFPAQDTGKGSCSQPAPQCSQTTSLEVFKNSPGKHIPSALGGLNGSCLEEEVQSEKTSPRPGPHPGASQRDSMRTGGQQEPSPDNLAGKEQQGPVRVLRSEALAPMKVTFFDPLLEGTVRAWV